MPTPVMHLALAEEILGGNVLPPAVRRLLIQQRGPFLLGHTVPDVQTISRQGREETHFYTIPRTTDRPAYETFLDAYPRLSHPETLPQAQAAFVAGYVAHLLLDELWLNHIFLRYFMGQEWASLHERLFLHNVLRTWMDARDQRRLDGSVAAALREVEPRGWLPFVSDEHLRVWRDWLAEQLDPAHSVETAEVFAQRMGVAVAEVEEVLRSPQQMEERVFRHVPRAALQFFHDLGYEQSVELIGQYLETNLSNTEEVDE